MDLLMVTCNDNLCLKRVNQLLINKSKVYLNLYVKFLFNNFVLFLGQNFIFCFGKIVFLLYLHVELFSLKILFFCIKEYLGKNVSVNPAIFIFLFQIFYVKQIVR